MIQAFVDLWPCAVITLGVGLIGYVTLCVRHGPGGGDR